MKFSLKRRFKSFKYAFNGLKILIKEEHNARIHLMATIVVIVAGFAFKISFNEWTAILLAIGLVFALEALNSSIENLADFVAPDINENIKKAKDLGAAAVLIGAIVAIVIGLIVFVPKIINLL